MSLFKIIRKIVTWPILIMWMVMMPIALPIWLIMIVVRNDNWNGYKSDCANFFTALKEITVEFL